MEDLKFITHYLQDEKQEIWFLMESNGFAFCKMYSYKSDNYLIISDLSVSETLQGHGVGSLIIQKSIDFATKKGFNEVWLWVDENSWMQKCYERKGFIFDQINKDIEGTVWMKYLIK